jgi:thymidylate synthase (FAD)
MTHWSEVEQSSAYVKVLDHGFVGLVDVMGDDSSIVQAARTSYGKGTKSVSEDRGLIRYLMRNFHTSVFEMIEFKFHIKLPIFVMRQHVRHRTANLNEYSGRYSVMTDEFYIPEQHRLQSQSVLNKQGSGAQLGGAELEAVHDLIKHMSTESYKSYLALINDPQSEDYWPIDGRQGLSRELSRIILPQNNYTECYWRLISRICCTISGCEQIHMPSGKFKSLQEPWLSLLRHSALLRLKHLKTTWNTA